MNVKRIAGMAMLMSSAVWAQTATNNNLNLQGGFLYNHGMVDAGDLGVTFTNAGVRDLTVSVGQLSGVNPDTGAAITNSANLIPLKAQSLDTAGDVIVGGSFVGNASGLTGLNVEQALPAESIASEKLANSSVSTAKLQNHAVTTAKIRAGSVTMAKIAVGAVGSKQIADGAIQIEDLGFDPRSVAGGSNGSLQFNQNGQLAGNTNFFVHSETGKLAFYAREGNLFRAFKGTEVSEADMIYVLRRFEGTTELCMFKDGVETIRLRGDGSIYATGALEVGGLSLGGGGTSGSTGWFIPEEGDLSMGTFTQE